MALRDMSSVIKLSKPHGRGEGNKVDITDFKSALKEVKVTNHSKIIVKADNSSDIQYKGPAIGPSWSEL